MRDCHVVAKICVRTNLLTDDRVRLLCSAFRQSKWNELVGSFARSAQLHEFHSVNHRKKFCFFRVFERNSDTKYFVEATRPSLPNFPKAFAMNRLSSRGFFYRSAKGMF